MLLETFAPGEAASRGLDHATLRERNPRLVQCSITGYGDHGRHADRPAIDALVAARTGHQWESRGVEGGTIARLAGIPAAFPDLETPPECQVAAPRPGTALLRRAVGQPRGCLPGDARDQRRTARAWS